MERNGVDAAAAFAILKSHSQATGQKLFEVAQAVTLWPGPWLWTDRSVKHLRCRVTDALTPNQAQPSGARQRILDNAYELFSRRGIRAVGVEEVISRAGVAKATLYRHFPSKDDLVLAFLEEREERWTRQFVEAGARQRGASAEECLVAIFDVFHDWFQQEEYEGCSFINVLLETGDRDHPVGNASARYLANIRTIVRTLAEEAGLRDPEAFALSWHLLMKGAIVQAAEGDRQAAQRAKAIARLLLDQHR